MEKDQLKSIEKVQEENTPRLKAIKGVVGVGIGELDGKPCVKVLVDRRTRRLVKQIPKSIDGYLVLIEETGEFKTRKRILPY